MTGIYFIDKKKLFNKFGGLHSRLDVEYNIVTESECTN